MFYAIIALLILLYYFFRAPKSLKNTLNAIFLVAAVVILGVLAVLSFQKILSLSAEIYVAVGMIVTGFLTIRDILNLSEKE